MFCKICSDISQLTSKPSTFHQITRLYQTHYDVLKLKKDCSAQDIRNAFIKLSKEHHPDVNKCKTSHSTFLQINEAYKVLGKADSRKNYDLGLANPQTNHSYDQVKEKPYYHTPHRPQDPYDDPSFWRNRDQTRDKYYEENPYYGINGIPKMPNAIIAGYTIFLAFVMVAMQVYAINHSFTFRREELQRKSLEAEGNLKSVKDFAGSITREEKIELLKIRLLGETPKDK